MSHAGYYYILWYVSPFFILVAPPSSFHDKSPKFLASVGPISTSNTTHFLLDRRSSDMGNHWCYLATLYPFSFIHFIHITPHIHSYEEIDFEFVV